MSLWSRLIGRRASAQAGARAPAPSVAKSGISQPAAWLLEAFGGSRSSAGIPVTPAAAMRASAVFACVRVISETVAALPRPLYRRGANGVRVPVDGHPARALLWRRPNAWQTPYEFFQAMVASMALRGNAYAQVIRGPADGPTALHHIPTDRVTVLMPQGRPVDAEPVYEVELTEGTKSRLPGRDVLHFRGPAMDGASGLDMVALAKEAIALSLAAEDYGARFFANDARASLAITLPGRFGTEEEARRFSDAIREATTGNNRHRPLIMTEGATLERLNFTSEEAQFLELRKFQVGDIARLWRVPPHMVGDLDRATFSNIEQQSIDFVVYTLMPYLTAIEQALDRTLLSEREQADHYIAHSVEGLLRGDSAARSNLYSRAILDGWMTRNEVRALEELPPLPELDTPLQPANMVPAGYEPDPAAAPDPSPDPASAPPPEDPAP